MFRQLYGQVYSYNCIIIIIRSRHITTVAIPTLVSCRRSYPPVEGAHIALREQYSIIIIIIICYYYFCLLFVAIVFLILFIIILFLGTVRRFLEHFTDEIDLIVFVAEDDDVSNRVGKEHYMCRRRLF